MPILTINILEGRDKETKKRLMANVTDAVTSTLGVPRESVRIIIREMDFENFGIAGLPVKEYRESK